MTNPKKLTPSELAAIRERKQKATKGPWYASYNKIWGEYSDHLNVADIDEPNAPIVAFIHNPSCRGDDLFHPEEIANADFIAHARQDVPDLLSHIAALEADLAAEQKLVARLGEVIKQQSHNYHCPKMYGEACDCWKAQALALIPAEEKEGE